MKVVAIIQARMGSTRLPGKVLADLAGEPMLTRVVNRVRRARTIQTVIVAATLRPDDQSIVRLCEEHGWPCFLGSEDDVLDRYYQAARENNADVIVRITSDCPLIDPAVIDRVVHEFLEHQPEVDYASNIVPRRMFPRGLDVEVFRFDVLERVWREEKNPASREHVTPYIYRNPDRFRMYNVTAKQDTSELRWTVDTPEDLSLVREIYQHFGDDNFSWTDVIDLLEEHPQLLEINRHVQQKVI